MFRINHEGFAVDCEDAQPVALVAHECVAVEAMLGEIPCLLLHFDGQHRLPDGALISPGQLHQVAISLEQARALADAINAIAERQAD